MKFKDVFPLFLDEYKNINPNIGNKLLTLELSQFIEFAEEVLYQATILGTDKFHSSVKLLLEDILLSKKEAINQELEVLHFLQFYFSTRSATYLCNNGRFTQAHNWLVWSISDNIEFSDEVNFRIERIHSFIHSKNSTISENSYIFIEWMTTLFYYSRHHGGLKDLALLILNQNLLPLSNITKIQYSELEEKRRLDLLCQALAWTINNKIAFGSKLAHIIEKWIPNLKPVNQKTANLQLATGGYQFTNNENYFYAKKVIDNFSQYCSGHELLHAQSIYYTSHLQELELDSSALDEGFNNYLSSIKELNYLSKKYEKSRIFGIIKGLIIACLEIGKCNLAFSIISKYYEKNTVYNCQLFIVLNINKQICSYILENNNIKGNELNKEQYRHLIYTTNKFLGTQIMLSDDPDFILEKAKNIGIPNKDFGQKFEAELSNYYSFNKFDNSFFNTIKSLIILPGPQHPIQALMIKELGLTAPINCSFEIPKPQKKVKYVLLLCYGTLSSDRELELVPKIFQKSDIIVHSLNVLKETKKSFLEKYNNPMYDIIWIATHGNYNHMLPHQSTLSILPNIDITINELSIQQSNFYKQRLLFLNVCDGATSSTHNSIYEHGFGASLANSSQCVISHLWPIETEPALFYGILYASNLLKHDFFDSYVATINQLCNEGKKALTALSDQFKEIDFSNMEENLNNNIQKNIYYWGSSVYYN